jgi:hypothetical protein
MDHPVTEDKSFKESTPAEAKSGKSLKQKIIANKKKLLVLGGVLLVILLLISGNSYLQYREKQLGGSDNAKTSEGNAPVPGAIAKVGNEYIFQTDLDVEAANYPGPKNAEVNKKLIEKLVKDSVVLQSAEAEKIASVSADFYNTPNKNFTKRMARIKDIKSLVNNKTDHLKGTIINVWFNNYEPAKIGLEAGKKQAFERISALQKRVINREITIDAAGEIIRRDASYANLDVGYKSNASFSFNEKKGDKITFNPDFDQELWRLNPGEVTNIYLGSIVSGFTNQSEESFYAFGQVVEKVDNGNNLDFDGWLNNHQKNYEITYY